VGGWWLSQAFVFVFFLKVWGGVGRKFSSFDWRQRTYIIQIYIKLQEARIQHELRTCFFFLFGVEGGGSLSNILFRLFKLGDTACREREKQRKNWLESKAASSFPCSILRFIHVSSSSIRVYQ